MKKLTFSLILAGLMITVAPPARADVAVENYNDYTALSAGDSAVVDLPDTADRFHFLPTAADVHFSTDGEIADASDYIVQENKDWVASYAVDKIGFYADSACTVYIRTYQLKN